MASIFNSFIKTVSAAGTPEVLGASSVRFNTALALGYRGEGIENGDKVAIQYSATNDEAPKILEPGQVVHIQSPNKSIMDASQLYIDVAIDGDGVLFIYTLADPKIFHDLEYRLEQAMTNYVKTIALSIDDCTITPGLADSDEEQGADAVYCFVSEAEQSGKRGLQWVCQCQVVIKTHTNRDGPLERHRLRTGYVRNLFQDEQAETIMTSLGDALFVQPGSIQNRQLSSRVENLQYISEFAFTVHAAGVNITG